MDKLKMDTIKKLKDLKQEIRNKLMEENYTDIINTLIDYDNEAQDKIYLYDNIQQQFEFVDEEMLEYLIKQNAEWGIDRLRYFIGDTYSADIYMLDVYGNLQNVVYDDFEIVIDEAISMLEN